MEPPVCLALLLCERVVRDLKSGRLAIVGTFDRATVESLPAPVRFTVYVALRGQQEGKSELTLRVMDSEYRVLSTDGHFATVAHATVEFPVIPSVVENAISFSMNVEKPGYYWIELMAGDVVLASHPFLVREGPRMGR